MYGAAGLRLMSDCQLRSRMSICPAARSPWRERQRVEGTGHPSSRHLSNAETGNGRVTPSTSRTSAHEPRPSPTPRRPRASTRARQRNGGGNGSFRDRFYRNDRTGHLHRHHLHESVVQRAVHMPPASPASGSQQPATPCAIRSTPPPGVGYDIRTIQELLGHAMLSSPA